MDTFNVSDCTIHVPILVSVPHCGTEFPVELASDFNPSLSKWPDDTDWFVDQLYDFVHELGIPMIRARYSRWVIDLNRSPENKALYDDGRSITGLCPMTDFHGNPIYKANIPDEKEIERRLNVYYLPYYQKIQEILHDMIAKFGHALLWDAHSIRRMVPSISPTKFPDMVLGSVDGSSSHPILINTALDALQSGSLTVQHNHPFKGGQITRHFGKPDTRQYALQLELCKDLYMDEAERVYENDKAIQLKPILQATLEALLKVLKDGQSI